MLTFWFNYAMITRALAHMPAFTYITTIGGVMKTIVIVIAFILACATSGLAATTPSYALANPATVLSITPGFTGTTSSSGTSSGFNYVTADMAAMGDVMTYLDFGVSPDAGVWGNAGLVDWSGGAEIYLIATYTNQDGTINSSYIDPSGRWNFTGTHPAGTDMRTLDVVKPWVVLRGSMAGAGLQHLPVSIVTGEVLNIPGAAPDGDYVIRILIDPIQPGFVSPVSPGMNGFPNDNNITRYGNNPGAFCGGAAFGVPANCSYQPQIALVMRKQNGQVTLYSLADNAAPVANAGMNQIVLAGSLVTLSGTGSSDANGDPLTYTWAIVSKPVGSGAALSSATSPSPSFIADVAGVYIVTLTVNDGKVDSSPASVVIMAEALVPAQTVDYYLYGGIDYATFLGCLSCSKYDSDSVCNNYGTYGSSYSTYSIWNEYGTYGSPYNLYSPWNSYSISGPLIMGSDGSLYGYFTTNSFKSGRTQIPPLLSVLNFYANTSSLAATRTFFCGN